MYPASFGCGSILANPLHVATQTLICTPAWLTQPCHRDVAKPEISIQKDRAHSWSLTSKYFVWNETRMHQHDHHAVGFILIMITHHHYTKSLRVGFIIGKILNMRTELLRPLWTHQRGTEKIGKILKNMARCAGLGYDLNGGTSL